MNKLPSRMSAARRNAEAALSKTEKRESEFRLEQRRELEAMALKTERLRALRLAKEAADQLAAAAKPTARARPKVRRAKQT
jgi:hypothetical protein